jgi:multimeric flavodoxin WrbA
MAGPDGDELRFVALNCTLKPGPEASSTDVLLDAVTGELEALGCTGERIRVVDAGIAHGVSADEGDADGWPAIRRRILDAHILVLGTPIWLGHPSSVAQQVLERLDAFLGETDDRGQTVTVDRVALVAVVGNEDGAHHVGAELFQASTTWASRSRPAPWRTGWAKRWGRPISDLPTIPEATMSLSRTMAANAVHLVGLLTGAGRYPSIDGVGS